MPTGAVPVNPFPKNKPGPVKEALRILTDLLEEIHELPDGLAAAIASQPAD